MTPDEREDVYSDGIELRAAPPESPGPGVLAGYAIKWDTLSEPLVNARSGQGFVETFRPGAFSKSLEGADVLAVVDHRESAGNVLGRTPGTLKLSEDRVGLRFENVLPDTTDGRDIARKVARGDIRGVSVGFLPEKGGVEWVETRSAMPTRVVSSARIVHLSYEPRPAYRDTTVALRSLEAARAGEPEVPAADDQVMIALYPPADIAARLAIEGGESAESLHLTLAYLGRAIEVGTSGIERAAAACGMVASWGWQLSGSISGIGRFSASKTSDGKDVIYASADLPALPELRQRLVSDLESAGLAPSRIHGFTPHITLAYVDPAADSPVSRLEPISVAFGAICLVVGGERREFPLAPGISLRSADQEPPPATPEQSPSHDLSAALTRLRAVEAF